MGRNIKRKSQDLAIRLCKGYVNGPNGCMNWTGAIDKWGYGVITIGSKIDGTHRTVLAHRLSASVFSGFDLDSELCKLHKCDNPRCINPDHLFTGTVADNNWDRSRKGRNRYQQGERGTKSKLKSNQVTEIRRLCSAGAKQNSVAEQYGVNIRTIWALLTRRTWRDVP